MEKLEELYIEILDKCNLKCKHCSTEACQEKNTFMKIETYERIIEECIELGLKNVFISGGEPLLHPNLLKMIEFTKNKNLNVRVYSCGVDYIDNKYYGFNDEYFRKLKNIGVDRIIFSMHGIENNHNYITDNKIAYQCLLETIKNCKKANLEFEIHTVPMSNNYKELNKIIESAEELGAKKVSLLRLVPQGRLRENKLLLMNRKQYEDLKSIANDILDKYKDFVRIGHPFNVLLNHCEQICNAGKNKILLDVYGNCYPCEAFKTILKGNTSNYFEHSIEYIWNNDMILNKLRNKKIPSECEDCKVKEKCMGGCFGQRYLAFQDLSTYKDPICNR